MNLSRNFLTASVVCMLSCYHISTHSWEPTLLIGWNLAESKQCRQTKVYIRLVRFIFSTVNFIVNVIVCVVLGIAVSGLMLRLKAKELANDPEFKASLGWYRNWKRRHSPKPPNEDNSGSTPAL